MFVILAALAGLGVMLAASSARGSTLQEPIARRTSRSRLATFHLDHKGHVIERPSEIAREISRKLGRKISVTATALATAIASEVSGPRIAQIGVGWAVKNYARYRTRSVFRTISPDGKFGRQGSPGHGYISTARPPTAETVAIAEGILSNRIPDPTGGAIKFDSPRMQLLKWRQGDPRFKHPDEIAARRRNAQLAAVYLPSVDPDKIRFWRPTTRVTS